MQGAVQTAVAKSGKVLCRVLCRVLSRLRWRSLAKVLCRVLCRVLSRLQWRSLAEVVQGPVQGAAQTAVAKSGKGAVQGAV